MDFELSLLPVAATTVAGLACYVIYRRLVGSKPTNDATAAAVAATTAAAAEPGLARKVLFADESYDDWQSVLSLESWDAFDAYFQAKYIDTEVFAGGATVVISDKQGVVHRRVFGAHWDCFGGKGASKGVRGTTRLCGFRDAINAAFQLQRQA